jgi:hypothetical protein
MIYRWPPCNTTSESLSVRECLQGSRATRARVVAQVGSSRFPPEPRCPSASIQEVAGGGRCETNRNHTSCSIRPWLSSCDNRYRRFVLSVIDQFPEALVVTRAIHDKSTPSRAPNGQMRFAAIDSHERPVETVERCDHGVDVRPFWAGQRALIEPFVPSKDGGNTVTGIRRSRCVGHAPTLRDTVVAQRPVTAGVTRSRRPSASAMIRRT